MFLLILLQHTIAIYRHLRSSKIRLSIIFQHTNLHKIWSLCYGQHRWYIGIDDKRWPNQSCFVISVYFTDQKLIHLGINKIYNKMSKFSTVKRTSFWEFQLHVIITFYQEAYILLKLIKGTWISNLTGNLRNIICWYTWRYRKY